MIFFWDMHYCYPFCTDGSEQRLEAALSITPYVKLPPSNMPSPPLCVTSTSHTDEFRPPVLVDILKSYKMKYEFLR